MLIEGVGNLLTYIANCCKPIIGDDITGYITMGRGIAIHRKNCANIRNVIERNPERLIDVSWGESAKNFFKADCHIIADDRPHLLRDITNILSNEKINLLKLNTQLLKDHVDIDMTIEIKDLLQFQRFKEKICQLSGIISLRRIG